MTYNEEAASARRDDELAQIRQTILDAASYRSGPDSCNSVYLGSLGKHSLYVALGGSIGRDSLYELLDKATLEQLRAAEGICSSVIISMRTSPRMPCPVCKSPIPKLDAGEPLDQETPERLYLMNGGDGLVWCVDPDPDGKNDVAVEYVRVGVWRKPVETSEDE